MVGTISSQTRQEAAAATAASLAKVSYLQLPGNFAVGREQSLKRAGSAAAQWHSADTDASRAIDDG
jgi:hypothetical protein